MRFYDLALAAALRWSPIPLFCGALIYHTGIPGWLLGEGSYHRRVQEPVSVVAAALRDIETDALDRGEGQAGSQFDLPQILRSETADGFVWHIVKDGKVTAEMTATLKPTDDGAATDILGSVKLIGSQHAVSAQAIQIVFANALDGKLASLGGDSGFGAEQLRAKDRSSDGGLTGAAILEDPLAIARAGLQAEEEERRLEREMRQDHENDDANRGVNFKPGDPMIDVDPNHGRGGR